MSPTIRFINGIIYTALVAAGSVVSTKAYEHRNDPTPVQKALQQVNEYTASAHSHINDYKLERDESALYKAVRDIREAIQANKVVQVQAKLNKKSDMEALQHSSNQLVITASELPDCKTFVTDPLRSNNVCLTKGDVEAAVAQNDAENERGIPTAVARVKLRPWSYN